MTRPRVTPARTAQPPVARADLKAAEQPPVETAPSTRFYEIKSTGDPLTGKHVPPPNIPAGLTTEQAQEFLRVAGQAHNLAHSYFPGVIAKASGLPAETIDVKTGARYLDNISTEIGAADSLEKQMLEQICALHLTFGQLCLKAAGIKDTDAFRVVMEVALRCQAEHRRTTLGLMQYRFAKQKLAAGAGSDCGAATNNNGNGEQPNLLDKATSDTAEAHVVSTRSTSKSFAA